jgi:hypothetical protein
VPLMVVGRATEARPAANFHTRFFSLIFLIPDCISEVGAEFDYLQKSWTVLFKKKSKFPLKDFYSLQIRSGKRKIGHNLSLGPIWAPWLLQKSHGF